MPANFLDCPLAVVPKAESVFATLPRLQSLHSALVRAVASLRPSRWNEPAVFFFDRKRQAELEAARPPARDRFAELTDLIAAEIPGLLAALEMRRAARALEGLQNVAQMLAPYCPAAKELAELLAVPDDEVFLVLTPADRAGVRFHVSGAVEVAQLHRLLAEPNSAASFPGKEGASAHLQLFMPAALQPDGTLPVGFAGCEHWLWPTQPLSAIPRIRGERVVLVGPAVVRPSLEVEPRFPGLVVECEVVERLNAFQTTDALSRLCGRPVPVQTPVETPAVARAA